jgi:hypothetical protein
MDKNSSLLTDADPLIVCKKWYRSIGVNTDCTWLEARFNPAGMRLIQGVDADVEFAEGFGHHVEVMGAMHNAGVTPLDLKNPDGLEKLHRWMVGEVDDLGEDSSNKYLFPSKLLRLLEEGFPYAVKCKNDSPLLGWFVVLGGKQYG